MRLVFEKKKNNSVTERVEVVARRYEIRARNTGTSTMTINHVMAVLAGDLMKNAELLEGGAVGQEAIDTVRDNLLYYAGFLRAEF